MKSGEHVLWDAHVETARSRASWLPMFRVDAAAWRDFAKAMRRMQTALEETNRMLKANRKQLEEQR